MVYKTDNLPPGKHQIKVIDRGNGPVAIDALIVAGGN